MIKWIGQHIFDLISRFRSTVYLENLETSTETNILVVDSDGKVTKNPDAGDDTIFVLEDGDGTEVSISDGKEIKFVEGGGIDINWTDTDNGTDADPYDLTFTVNKTLSDFLADTSGVIEHVNVGQDLTIGSTQDIILHIDKDDSSDSKDDSSTVTIRNGAGTDILTIDESGNIVTRGTITAQTAGGVTKYPSKGSAGNFLVDDAGAIKTRTATNIMADLSGQAGADFAMNSQKITGVSDPTSNQDAATKAYVDTRATIKPSDASGTNAAGASLTLSGGISTGNAEGGSIIFKSNNAGSSGTSANAQQTIAALDSDGNLQVDGTLTTGGTLALNTSGVIQVANQSNITGVGTLASGNATAIVDAASDTAAGKVELATTAEADTGTDTARAVTPAGLKSHVDARYSYQYIPLSMNLTDSGAGNWEYASGNGIGNHLYNQDGGASGTTASNTDGSASTITINKNQISGGIIVPYDCVLVGFYAQTRSNDNSARGLGIFTGTPVWNDYADTTAYLRGAVQNDTSVVGGDDNYSVRPFEHSVLNINLDLDAGDCIWMAGRDPAGAGGGMIASVTVVLKTLIP